jgi:formate dehydrogenase major subunit
LVSGKTDAVHITSRFGQIPLRARLTDKMIGGGVYTTFHHAKSQANNVTSDLSDWATNCPEYKVTAIEAARIAAASHRGAAPAETAVRAEPALEPGE